MVWRIEYSPEAEEHIKALTASQRALVVDAVDEQLTHQPTVETRNRKVMKPNIYAQWELRLRDLRVFYKVDEEEGIVSVRGVGVKIRNRIRLGNEELDLQ